ncbi:metallophosphoesterase family protein [Microvirga terricola]|uniref:Metallophosphoesterase n=1 Tax=Microvirga terricola TaxID=2719797 RepID=A0ABX0V8P4_9HYPH|nr:metallophosphoesterase [Microvirga terricola]NIX76224.1 metallophosphoesterase [Microvirga terricola]
MFRLAHLSDPHVGPLPRPQLRQLMSKRLTGWINWQRSRREAHDMALLATLVADLRAQHPTHIACTGDTCNIGLPSEWATSRVFLEGLGDPEHVSFVPGNHDAYVPGALEGLLREVGPWTRSDDGSERVFPFLRRYGSIALIGLSSAIPTMPFIASGRIGRQQMMAAEHLLRDLGEDESCFRIVLIHHPPHVGGTSAGRNLKDARAFEAMIARVGAELVLHGHNHVGSVAHLPGPRGLMPVVGAPSASAGSGTATHRAGYHLFEINQTEAGFTIRAERRGLKPDGSFGSLGLLSLTPHTLAEDS